MHCWGEEGHTHTHRFAGKKVERIERDKIIEQEFYSIELSHYTFAI